MPSLPSVATDGWDDQFLPNDASMDEELPPTTRRNWGFTLAAATDWSGLFTAGRTHASRSSEETKPFRALTDCDYSPRLSEAAKLFDGLELKNRVAQAARQQVKNRISFLLQEAKSEGIPFDRASEVDFWRFIDARPLLKKPRVFLVDNGNLRAVWKGEKGAHIGLQFLGDGKIQYVVFATRPGTLEPSRSYGRDTFEGTLRQIAGFEIEDLISE